MSQVQIDFPKGPSQYEPIAEAALRALQPASPEADDDGLTPQMVGELYEEFLLNGRTVKELAAAHGLPVRVVAAIARRGDWAARRQALEIEEIFKAESEYRKFLQENKLPTAKKQLAVGNKLLDKLEVVIDRVEAEDGDPSNALRRLAEAAKSAADIGARAAGIGDTPVSDYLAKLHRTEDKSKTPIIVVGLAPVAAEEPTL